MGMTQEDRELLLKDIYARLPYGIFVKEGDVDDRVIYTYDYHPHIETCKPYLRPMSSMTGKEANEWHKTTLGQRWITFDNVERCVDWLNEHHFDYRGLIEKGLALEAPEGMYETE